MSNLLLVAAAALCLKISVDDVRTQTIDDRFVFVLAILGLLYQHSTFNFVSIAGAALGFGIFGVLYVLGKRKWIGSGDVLLAGAIGLFFTDPMQMLLCIFTSWILAAAVSGFLIMTKKSTTKHAIAFAPFLCVPAIALLI